MGCGASHEIQLSQRSVTWIKKFRNILVPKASKAYLPESKSHSRAPSKRFFPTCQVRVVRFYHSCSPPPPPRLAILLLLLLLLLPLLRQHLLHHLCLHFHVHCCLANSSPSSPPTSELSVHRWTSSNSARSGFRAHSMAIGLKQTNRRTKAVLNCLNCGIVVPSCWMRFAFVVDWKQQLATMRICHLQRRRHTLPRRKQKPNPDATDSWTSNAAEGGPSLHLFDHGH